MAESTTTPTRRLALQDISTNVSLVHSASPFGPRRAGGGGAGAAGTTKAAGGAAQSRLLGTDTGAGEPRPGAPRGALRGEAQLGGAKRVFDLVYSNHEGEGAGVGGRDGSPEVDGGEGGGAKRTRVETLGEGADDDVLSVRGMQSEDVGFPVSVHEEDTSSSALSPPSSLVCSNNWLNDSQSTVVTEPDDPRAGVMRGEELRLKARTLKLRLRLAKYKVQTNQIDTPMSQLKIKNTSESPELSTVPILAHTPRHRPLSSSSRTSNTHSVSNREQNQGKKQSLSSSPPSYPEAASHDESSLESREAISTPLLPRQRQGLLNPPSLGGDFEDRSPARELTSSVVKGRAANGLLSLMAHQG